MKIELLSAAFVAALVLAGLMGFAIQRGATCTVAAIDEIVNGRRYTRLQSMLEASLWVATGLLIGLLLHLTPLMPRGFPLGWGIVAGGALLGLGAYINRGCVFGAIARLGSGELAYLATPLGFLLGCMLFRASASQFAPQVAVDTSPVLAWAQWAILPMAAFLVWRLAHSLRGAAWTPRAATAVIGVAFVLLLMLVGDQWAYTDVLSELAAGKLGFVLWRLALLLALFAGAAIGGYTAGRFRLQKASMAGLLRCLSGGLLMGFGSLLIPGSNDGMILLGMPLLLPHAWLGFLSMCVTVALAMRWNLRKAR